MAGADAKALSLRKPLDFHHCHTRHAMRSVLAILILADALLFSETAIAATQRWCSVSNEGASDCSHISAEQCRASVAGAGGSCMPEAPTGHLQPRPGNAAATPLPRDDKLEALLERVNRKSNSLILCRGC
jgi:hypothetical protein